MDKATEWLKSFKEIDNYKNIHNIHLNKIYKAQTISITSGKGGVGKTSIALRLGLELAKSGKRILLIDCDYNLSNTAIKLGIPLNNDLHNLITYRKDFDDCLYKIDDFHLLSGCSGNMDFFENGFDIEKVIIDIIKSHEHLYDYIILDSPAGLSKDSLTMNAYCNHRLFIVTPDKSSLTDSYALMKILKRKYGVSENHLIVNKVLSIRQYKKIVKTLSETAENFLDCRTIILGKIDREENNASSVDNFSPGNFNSNFHINFFKILNKFTESCGETARADGNSISFGP